MSTGVFGGGAAFTTSYVESVLAGNVNWPITASQYGDLTSISLTPGEWDVTGLVQTVNNGAITAAHMIIGISATAGNASTGLVASSSQVIAWLLATSAFQAQLVIPNYRVVVAATTTYYLKGLYGAAITNLQYAGCRISARKVA